MARNSRGRQRVEMVKMKNESNRQVTFSKRRFGVFKKASELVTLCGAEVALIVFSPGQRVFSFGHPNAESIIERYINGNENSGYSTTDRPVEAYCLAAISELTTELIHAEHLLDLQKEYGIMLDQMMKNNPNKNWWEAPVDELTPQQVIQLKVALEDLKKNVDGEVHAANTNPYMLESGLFDGRNVAAYGARFNRGLANDDATTSMVPPPRTSGASSPSMPWI